MSERKSFPLSWPEGWRRTKTRVRAAFGKTQRDANNFRELKRLSVADSVQRVIAELGRMGVPDWNVILSTNVQLRLDGLPRSDREPSDPGVAVYWKPKENAPSMKVIAIDRYDRVADNLAAIAATLEAMRTVERHGGAEVMERQFLGFAALPEKAAQPWREVLGIAPEQVPTADLVQSRFRALVKLHHPDTGGKEEDFQRIVQAKDAALMELAS
jgi:hypothetical protein